MSHRGNTRDTYIIIYGGGGHQTQMQRLLAKGLMTDKDNINIIAITDSQNPIKEPVAQTYTFKEYRDKNSYWVTILTLPFNTLNLIYTSLNILRKNNVKGVISTGPGIAIIPSLIFWLFRKKLVVFETWSKFYKPTINTKILSHFSGITIIQHESLRSVYPKAKYWGKL